MKTNPITIRAEQVIDLAVSLMEWRRMPHVPVEDSQHRFIGMVTYHSLLQSLLEHDRSTDEPQPVSSVMVKEVATVSPDTPLRETLTLMLKEKLACLPVVEDGQLVGILRERDFPPIASQALESRPLQTR